MMTDRELLEYAAKAAGIEPPKSSYEGCIGNDGSFVFYLDCEGRTVRRWNPLEDDTDAFRLMVDLNLTEKHSFLDKLHEENTTWSPDYRKAHRRAIVRAAAEIGRNMIE